MFAVLYLFFEFCVCNHTKTQPDAQDAPTDKTPQAPWPYQIQLFLLKVPFPLPLNFRSVGRGPWEDTIEFEVVMVLAVFRRYERLERLIAWLRFCVFYEHKTRKTKTGLQTYLLVTYELQFRSPISRQAHLLTFTYDSIYDTYIV